MKSVKCFTLLVPMEAIPPDDCVEYCFDKTRPNVLHASRNVDMVLSLEDAGIDALSMVPQKAQVAGVIDGRSDNLAELICAEWACPFFEFDSHLAFQEKSGDA